MTAVYHLPDILEWFHRTGADLVLIISLWLLETDVDSPQSGSPFLSGYHVTGSWAVTGETRAYRKRIGNFDPLPVAS